jgi:methylated-DNA-[protein]-cysteine S-methyltransferase
MPSELRFHVCETPLGWVAVTLADEGLRSITLPLASCDAALREAVERGAAAPAAGDEAREVDEAIGALVSGRPVKGSLRIDWRGITPFRRTVLEACATIPIGETRSYGWLAEQAGRPRAARAAGRVMATNPWPLLIPCHRVIGSNGGLHGYGGGLPMKEQLLRIEGAIKA